MAGNLTGKAPAGACRGWWTMPAKSGSGRRLCRSGCGTDSSGSNCRGRLTGPVKRKGKRKARLPTDSRNPLICPSCGTPPCTPSSGKRSEERRVGKEWMSRRLPASVKITSMEEPNEYDGVDEIEQQE